MFSMAAIIGLGVCLGIISIGEDVLIKKKQVEFLRLLETQGISLFDFCTSLLTTRAKDWTYADQLQFTSSFHPELTVLYREGIEKKGDQLFHIVFKKEKILELRRRGEEAVLEAKDFYRNDFALSVHETVKLERVLEHLREIKEAIKIHNELKKEEVKVHEEQRIAREIERIRQSVLTFLEQDVNWNNQHPHLYWTRQTDMYSVSLTLYASEEPQYVCFYDKTNKKMHSKVLPTDKAFAFTALKLELDDWCQAHIKS